VTAPPGADAGALVGVVVVSHSARLADGVVELARQMCGPDLTLIPVGGAPDGSLGTDADRIRDALVAADGGAGVVVLADLGSAILSTAAALEMVDTGLAARIHISGGPIAEGAVLAAVQASMGEPVEAVLAAAESACDLDKAAGR